MRKSPAYFSFKYLSLLLFLASFSALYAQGQVPVLKETNIYNEQKIVYNNDSIIHTSWKPVLYYDTTNTAGTGTWLHRKFFQEHLLQLREPKYNLDADIIFDESIGASKRNITTPMMNTRGFEISGNFSSKFYFESNFYENQGRFGGYIDSFIRSNRVIPGEGGFKNIGDGKGFDFSTASSRLIYMPNRHFTFDLGYGKNFIGDGYRSVLLSDWSYNYPYFKTSFTAGKFQYNVMWSQYISDRNKYYNNKQGYYRKWGQTFLVDWAATRRFSVSLFETVMWPDQDSMRNKDISGWLFSPVIFLHGDKAPSGLPNNSITGINLKYRVFNRTHLYGQLALDNTGGGWKSRYAGQLGIRTGNPFGVENLNLQGEFNFARPYTYATNSLFTNYQHNNQSLADPFGANYREGLAVAEYRYKNWYFRGESFVAKYGADSAQTNYGHNIFKPIYTHTVTDNVSIGQGVPTTVFYADLKVAYILNPATNMRIETGFTFRNLKNSQVAFKDRIAYIGIRMSFKRYSYDY